MYPEQSEDHEFPAEVVELVRVAAGPEGFRRTHFETTWYEPIPTEQLPLGRPIRTEGKPPRRTTYVAVDTLVFEVPRASLDHLVLDLVPRLRTSGYTVYGTIAGFHELAAPDYSRIWTSPSRPDTSILAVIQAKDSYEPLRIEGPGSADIPVPDLIRTLEEWRRFSSFEIVAADGRVLELAFRELPPKLTAFARAVYKLDPEAVHHVLLVEPGPDWDTIDYIRATDAQTTGDLVRYLRRTRRLQLLWP